MRVTYNTLYSSVINYIDTNFDKINKTQEMISSGKKVNQLSDAPLDATKIVNLNNQIKSLDQYSKNITTAGMWLKTTDNALMQFKSSLDKIKVVTTQAASETYNYDQRKSLAANINIFADNIMEIANTEINGKYIFSGYKVNKKPFETKITTSNDNYSIDAYNYNFDIDLKIKFIDSSHYKFSVDDGKTWLDNNGNGYAINSVNPILGFSINSKVQANPGDEVDFHVIHEYVGDKGKFNIDIGNTQKLQVNKNGIEVFMPDNEKNIFKTLGKIWAGMITNNRDMIDDEIDNLNKIEKNILSNDADIGVKQDLLDNFKTNFIDQDKNSITSELSDLEDTDVAQAMTDLAKQQLVYQATLKTAAMISNLTILNYI